MSGEDFFQPFGMRPVDSAGFDAALDSAGDALVGVYFWGTDCFNCEQFKKAATLKQADFRALQVHWLQADIYADRPLGLRFALHGVPTFYFFHRGRTLGRITSWPGWPAFHKAVQDLHVRIKAANVAP